MRSDGWRDLQQRHHVGRRQGHIALLLAEAGYFPPVAGALAQEIIDVLAVPPRSLTDY